MCELCEEEFKIGEEWRVIQRPRRGGSALKIPFGERFGVRNRQPVSMYFKVSASVAREQENLAQDAHRTEPEDRHPNKCVLVERITQLCVSR